MADTGLIIGLVTAIAGPELLIWGIGLLLKVFRRVVR